HESYDTSLDDHVVYIGPHRMTDEITIAINEQQSTVNIGKLLLSPTRTYAPLMKILLEEHFDKIHGLIHCSGGGQTKCMKYLPGNFKIIKDDLFEPPLIFQLIQQSSHADNREMYQVFNMGHRLEIFANEKDAESIIAVSKQFNIAAKIIGRVEASDKKELVLKVKNEEIAY
ncbi:MAG TPA: AIR synthase-related protein, partial [Puia sp.]|nr:AIR synthase-related protein [Puia sp.]